MDSANRNENPQGRSWADAFPSLQQAINASKRHDEIWVKSGTHIPEGEGRDATFTLRQDLALYGGFKGSETNRTQRNPKARKTILSGDLGRRGFKKDNAHHVLIGATGCTIDGFTIKTGVADGEQQNAEGGGILLPKMTYNFTLRDCSLEKNDAVLGGAISAAEACSITLSNCTFLANRATHGGALHFIDKTKLISHNCTFSSNTADERGGAVFLQNASKTEFENVLFQYNFSAGHGGALWAKASDTVTLKLTETAFNHNRASAEAGAVWLEGLFSPELLECDFLMNNAPLGAGALKCSGGIRADLANCSFVMNAGATDEDQKVCDASSRMQERTIKPVVVEAPKPPPEKRKIPDARVHRNGRSILSLNQLVHKHPYTVLILADQTAPSFIRNYRKFEAIAHDYRKSSVAFHYIYRPLTHPENHGLLQPFTLTERMQLLKLARTQLQTQIPWLCDSMNNDATLKLAGDSRNAVFIYNQKGQEEYARPLWSTTPLATALTKLAGEPPARIDLDRIPLAQIEAIEIPETHLVPRVEIDPEKTTYHAVKLQPASSNHPAYAKPRIEVTGSLLENGDGKIYLGFHLDPLYAMEWNNRQLPLSYTLQVPPGSAVAPSRNTAPRITETPTDTEPREFLLEARKLNPTKPLRLLVEYAVYSREQKRNIPVKQSYTITLERDPCGGKVFNRQIRPDAKAPKKKRSYSAPPSSAFAQQAQLYDLNRDGRIARDEAANALQRDFDKIDTNQNNFIEAAEFDAFHKNSAPQTPPEIKHNNQHTKH